jgi:hypothetical protein
VGKALENQQQSIDELRKALDSLKNNRKKDQQQQQKSENGENNSISMDYGQGEEQAIKPGKEAKEQGENAPEEKDAAAILDEERDNMKNRRHESAIGYKEVERDW